jgi:hypothetical protein
VQLIKRRSVTPPWLALISFLFTVAIATREQWSAQGLAWAFWLAGLILGLIYLAVYQLAQGDSQTLLAYPLFLIIFYFIFAGFLDTIFAFASWDATGAAMPAILVGVPAAIAQAARAQWSFLLASALAYLPDYILDARTVHLTDLSKPLFGKDLLRMLILIFMLVPLTMIHAGTLALYPILLVYFLPWESLRWLSRTLRRAIWS